MCKKLEKWLEISRERACEMLCKIRGASRRGLTVTELVVVLVVIATLVLLATPRFLDHIDEPYLTRIISDIKILEDQLSAEIVDNETWYEGGIYTELSVLENAIANGI